MKRVNLMLSEDVLRYLDQQAASLSQASGKSTATRSMMVRMIVGGLADARASFSGPPDEKALRRSVSKVVSKALEIQRAGSTSTHHG